MYDKKWTGNLNLHNLKHMYWDVYKVDNWHNDKYKVLSDPQDHNSIDHLSQTNDFFMMIEI